MNGNKTVSCGLWVFSPMRDSPVKGPVLVGHLPDQCSRSQSFVYKILQSYDKENTGYLTHDALRAAMARLRLGLSEAEQEQCIRRLDGAGTGTVSHRDFVTSLEQLEAIGSTASSPRWAGITNNVQTANPWEEIRYKLAPLKRSKRE